MHKKRQKSNRMNKYIFSECDSQDEILEFWEESSDSTIFSHPKVLPLLVKEVKWFKVSKGSEIICFWPICLPNFKGNEVSRFAYYVGPLWSKNKLKQSAHRWFDTEVSVYNLVFSELEKLYISYNISLPVGVYDIRPFYWFFNSSIKNKLEIVPRYTAIISDLHEITNEMLLNRINVNRRRELKKVGISNSYYFSDCLSSDELFSLYSLFFQQRGYVIEQIDRSLLDNLYKIVQLGYGYFSAVRLKSSEELVSVCVILSCSKTSNLVLNLFEEKYINSGVGTANIFEAISIAKEKGSLCFDFNGANSYNLSRYKHSFGAVTHLYFDITAKKYENIIF